MLKLLDILALSAFCALIFWLSSQSHLPTPDLFEFQDKFHHFIAYFVMGVLAWRCYRHLISPKSLAIVSILFCSLYGLSDEWHQSFVPGRDASFLDLVADILGAIAAIVVLSRTTYYFKQVR